MMKYRWRIFGLCDGVSQQAINSQLTCFVNGNVHAYLLYYIHNIKQAVMLSKFCNYLNCILKILCWSLKLKNLATSLRFIGPHRIPRHFWIVLCSAPSVSQFFFTITEKAPTRTPRKVNVKPHVPYDFCVGIPILCLLTVGSMHV